MKLTDSPEIIRLRRKLGVELLWIFILSLLSKQKSHAYVIRQKISDNFGFLPGNVSAYVVLYKLESRGFVRAVRDENKVSYSITPEGKKLLQLAKKELETRREMLD